MKVYGYCLKPTLILEFKKKYLIEPLKKMESAHHYYYQRCSLEEAEYFKVLDAYNHGGYPVLVRADRFKPIPITKHYEPMKREEIEPLYIIRDNVSLVYKVGVSKDCVQEHIEKDDIYEGDFGNDVFVYKITVENGKIVTKEISLDIRFIPRVP